MEEGEVLEVGSNRFYPSCSKGFLRPRKISSHTPSSITWMQAGDWLGSRGRLQGINLALSQIFFSFQIQVWC